MDVLAQHNLDLFAIAWFMVLIGGYRIVAEWSPLERRSIVGAVQGHRIAWMRNMAIRDNRTLDGILLGHLSQGNAFFASTSAIAIGGLAALMGSGEKVQAMLEGLPFVARSPAWVWETKILLLMGIFIYAFFKFAWAFRLSHYTAIMIGSTPVLSQNNLSDCERHAEATAKLVGIAAEHANAGIRSFYYAIAAIAWFFHPLAFMLAASWVLIILIRRDFFSRSLRILTGSQAHPPAAE
jgi:uncharacterized membrane protein